MESEVPYSDHYDELYRKGFFDVAQFISVHDLSGSYVWLPDMEWLRKSSVLNFEYDEDMNPNVKPFAISGGGDYFGWFDDGESTSEMPVVFCPTDDDKGFFYAPNLLGAIFRQIIEFSSQNNFSDKCGEEWEMSQIEAMNHINFWLQSFKDYFPTEWLNHLKDLTKKSLKLFKDMETGEEYLVLLQPDTAKKIIFSSLKYGKLDQKFGWFL